MQRQEFLNQLQNLYLQECIIYNRKPTAKELQTQTLVIESNQDLDSRTEEILYDNENYENMIMRAQTDNLILEERLKESRTMILKYELSTIKWLNICRESEITHQEISSKQGALNDQIILEKKDWITKIQQRKSQLEGLDMYLNQYDKELEHLKEQEIDASGRCYLLQRRIQYLRQRQLEFSKKRYYWSEKLKYIQLKFEKLQERFKHRGARNFHSLQLILLNEVIPKVIEKQSLENQSKDYLQRVMILQQTRGELIKELSDIKNQKLQKQVDSDGNQKVIKLSKVQDEVEGKKISFESIESRVQKAQMKINHARLTLQQIKYKISKSISKRDQYQFANLLQSKQSFSEIMNLKTNQASMMEEFLTFEAIFGRVMDCISHQIPKIDPNLNYAKLLNITNDYTSPNLNIIELKTISENDSDLDLKMNDLDLILSSSVTNVKVYSNLALSFNQMQLIYENYFQVNLNQSDENSKSLLFLRRKKTFRSIGMDMVKRQANVLINSKKSQDFAVYFHARRETDKMRKEMQSEIKELQKQKIDATLQNKVEEALINQLEKMHQNEIIKQEQQALNVQKMNNQIKVLFSDNKSIKENPNIKKKWEAQNMMQYRNVQERYRNLRQRLDKGNKEKQREIEENKYESQVQINAQKLQQKDFFQKIKKIKQLTDITSFKNETLTLKDDTSSLINKDSIQKNQISGLASSRVKIDLENGKNSAASSSALLSLIKKPNSSSLQLKNRIDSIYQKSNFLMKQEHETKNDQREEELDQILQKSLMVSMQDKTVSMKKASSEAKLKLPSIIMEQNEKRQMRNQALRQLEDRQNLRQTFQNSSRSSQIQINPYSVTATVFNPIGGSITTRSTKHLTLNSYQNQQQVFDNLSKTGSNFSVASINNLISREFNHPLRKAQESGRLLYKVMINQKQRGITDALINKKKQKLSKEKKIE